MKRKLRIIPRVLLSLFLAVTLVVLSACGGGQESSSGSEQEKSDALSSESSKEPESEASEAESSEEPVVNDPSITLDAFEGTLIINDGTDIVATTAQMPLYDGYSLETQEGSGRMMLDETKLVKIGPNTLAKLELTEDSFHFNLQNGDIFFCVTNQPGDEELITIMTQEATMYLGSCIGIIRSFEDTTIIVILEGSARYSTPSDDTHWLVDEGMVMCFKAGEKMQLSVRQGDIPDFAIDEILNNPMVRERMQNSEYNDFFTQEELFEYASRFVGTYQHSRVIGSKGEGYDFFMQVSYFLQIWITEDGHLHAKIYESEEDYAAIEDQNKILEEHDEDYQIEHYEYEVDMPYIRMRDENQLVFIDFYIGSVYLGTDGNLSQTENNDNLYQRVGE